jgi:hypothetical protein
MGKPVWTGKADINGKRMHAHKHRNPTPYGVGHRISGPNSDVAGNYDYEEGGIIDPADLALIVWLRNHADEFIGLWEAAQGLNAKWGSDLEELNEFQDVLAALAALDADT